jgi:hypothetical protein
MMNDQSVVSMSFPKPAKSRSRRWSMTGIVRNPSDALLTRSSDQRSHLVRLAHDNREMTTTTLSTLHANEVIVVDEALDPQGRATVTLGLVNQDRSDTFPGRTLSPDQADKLAASLVVSAAAARANAGLAPAPRTEAPLADTLMAIRAAIPLSEPEVATGTEHRQSAVEQAPPADERKGPEELPIANYDALKASKIIMQLPGLTAAELSAVLAYERVHRNRKKVRARVIELQADAPR